MIANSNHRIEDGIVFACNCMQLSVGTLQKFFSIIRKWDKPCRLSNLVVLMPSGVKEVTGDKRSKSHIATQCSKPTLLKSVRSIIGARERIFLRMQQFLPKFDLVFPK